jgi:hypothetical protein
MITIHCGLHKTGSSSIQLALELCSKRGRTIVTPKPGDDRSEQGWRKRLSKVARAQDAVFSDENLLGSPYDGYQLAPDRVAILRDALAGSPYQIVVYLRPHVDWLPSVYLQGVQEGRTIGPEDFWAAIRDEPYLRWANLMELLQRESGAERVIGRAHTRSRDTVADFFEVVRLGEPPRTGKTMIRENVSIGAAQAPILRELNALDGVGDFERSLFRAMFQEQLAVGVLQGLSPFPLTMQSEISSKCKGDWSACVAGHLPNEESRVFHAEIARYDIGAVPYAGASLRDPFVEEEALRSLQVLALSRQGLTKSKFARLALKFSQDPQGLPHTVIRRVRHLKR